MFRKVKAWLQRKLLTPTLKTEVPWVYKVWRDFPIGADTLDKFHRVLHSYLRIRRESGDITPEHQMLEDAEDELMLLARQEALLHKRRQEDK